MSLLSLINILGNSQSQGPVQLPFGGGTAPVGVRTKLGMNLPSLPYYSEMVGAVNMLQLQNQNFDDVTHSFTTTLDANGWPTTDFTVGMYPGKPSGLSTYTLQFDGQANVDFFSPNGASGLSGSYNSGTNKSTYTFSYASNTAPIYANVGPIFRFQNTMRMPADSPGDGLINLFVWSAPYVGNTSQIWSSEYVAYLAPWSVLRTMTAQQTNTDYTTTDWSTRQTGPLMIKISDWVALANACGADLWVDIPYKATTDWETGFFTYIAANLTGNLFFEYGNEKWNSGFPGWTYTFDQFCTEVHGCWGQSGAARRMTAYTSNGTTTTVTCNFTPDVSVTENINVKAVSGIGGTAVACVVTAVDTMANTITYSDTTSFPGSGSISSSNATMVSKDVVSTLTAVGTYATFNLDGGIWAARRLALASLNCRSIVGDSAMMTKFRPVLGQQQAAGGVQGNYDYYVNYCEQYASLTAQHVPYLLYGASGAPYVGSYNGGMSIVTGTAAQWGAAMTVGAERVNTDYAFGSHAAGNLQFGIKTMMYEGGFDLNYTGNQGPSNNAAKWAGRLDPSAKAGMDAFFHQVGFDDVDTFCWFEGTIDPKMNGNETAAANVWGFAYDDKVITPTWQAAIDYNALASASLPVQNPISCGVGYQALLDGRLYAGSYSIASPYPGLRTPIHNRTDWIINVGDTGTYTITLAYGELNHVGNWVLLVDNVSVATITNAVTAGGLGGLVRAAAVAGVSITAGVHLLSITGNGGGTTNNENFKSFQFVRTA